MNLDAGTIVAALLSAGGGAFLVSLVNSWSSLRQGARAGQREVVKDLMDWRDDLERQFREACADRDYWRDVAAGRGHQLRENGLTPYVASPVPPSATARPRVTRTRRSPE